MSRVYVEHLIQEDNHDMVSFSTSKITGNALDIPEWVAQYEFDEKDVEQCVGFMLSFLIWACPNASEIRVVYERQHWDWVLRSYITVGVGESTVTSGTSSPSLDYRGGIYVAVLFTCSEALRRLRDDVADLATGRSKHDTRLRFPDVQ